MTKNVWFIIGGVVVVAILIASFWTQISAALFPNPGQNVPISGQSGTNLSIDVPGIGDLAVGL